MNLAFNIFPFLVTILVGIAVGDSIRPIAGVLAVQVAGWGLFQCIDGRRPLTHLLGFACALVFLGAWLGLPGLWR